MALDEWDHPKGLLVEAGRRTGPDDVLFTEVKIKSDHVFPWAKVGVVSHRRDLADLAEPYLSAVKQALNR